VILPVFSPDFLKRKRGEKKEEKKLAIRPVVPRKKEKSPLFALPPRTGEERVEEKGRKGEKEEPTRQRILERKKKERAFGSAPRRDDKKRIDLFRRGREEMTAE